MRLQKTNEHVVRLFDEEGNAVERLESVEFMILTDEGCRLGSATCHSSNVACQINYPSVSVDDGIAQLKAILAIDGEEEGGEA